MRVLNVYRTYFPDPQGGLQEAIRQICLTTQPYGISNTIFTLSPTPQPRELERPEGKVLRTRSWAAPASCDIGSLEAFRLFRRQAQEADLIHFFFPWPFADLMYAIAGSGKPTVLTYVSDIVRQRMLGRLYSPLMWRMLCNVDAIVVSSHAYARTSEVLSHSSLRDHVRVIPFGINEHSCSQKADMDVLVRLGLQNGPPYFLFLGVLRYYKGLHTLIQAAGAVKARIVIAGSGSEADRLRAQVEQLSVNNVIFAGQVTDAEKVALLQQCLALVLPSHLRSEAYGLVLVEAAMLGKPMVSCEIGTGTSFINADGESGLVVQPENPQMLAMAMNKLLLDPELAGRLGKGARERYERFFNGDAMGKAYANLYREVIGRTN